MKIKNKTKREYDDDGLLPLVNIIFLLLIFFMIVGVIEQNIIKDKIELPTVQLDRLDNQNVTRIYIDNTKTIYFNDEQISKSQMSEKLKSLKNKNVIFIADKSLMVDDVNTVLEILQRNKITDIKLLSSLN